MFVRCTHPQNSSTESKVMTSFVSSSQLCAPDDFLDGLSNHSVQALNRGCWECVSEALAYMNYTDLHIESGSVIKHRLHILWTYILLFYLAFLQI